MKIISWNVNGLRAISKKGLTSFLKKEKADLVCLQEIKISEEVQIKTEFNFGGYRPYWNWALRPGYSGTLILVNPKFKKVIGIKNGLSIPKFDIEGRVQTLELSKFYLLNVYFPNSNRELSRLDYKLEFNNELLKYLKKLKKKKPVIITGDFNVAHQEIDLARPQSNEGSAGFTKEERAWFTKLLKEGFLDSFRFLQGSKVQYSWWSYRTRARLRNIGWRLDYFCLSSELQNNLEKSYILDKIDGSDHAPIGLELSV